jgi:acetylglutamate kinase
MKPTLKILKLGGKLLEDPGQLDHALNQFAAWDDLKIMVHGGGRSADQLMHQIGIEPRMNKGRRITDEQTLKAVTMVYAGWLNKNIVAQLHAKTCDAIGLCGADANVVNAELRSKTECDFGFVGDVKHVGARRLKQLLTIGLTPVLSAITHDGKGQLLNTNADTVAAQIAIACAVQFEVELIFCHDKNGVLKAADDDTSTISKLSFVDYETMKQEQTIKDGMLPKLANGFDAASNGVEVSVSGLLGLENPVKSNANLTTLC